MTLDHHLPIAVALVCRHVPSLGVTRDRIAAFVDVSQRVTQDGAMARGSPRLLDRVLAREAATVTEPLVFHHWVWKTLQTTPDVPLVLCLVPYVHPGRSLWDALSSAIASNNLSLVQWLYASATARDGSASPATQDALLRDAVTALNIEIVTYLLDQRSPAPPRKTTKPLDLSAVAKGLATPSSDADAKWAIVELLLQRLGHLAHRSLPVLAAQQGRLGTLQLMQTHGVALGQAVANAAAANGHFDIVEVLGQKPTNDAMDDAAIVDKVEVLQALYIKFQCEATAVGVLRAADNGRLAVLQWMWTTFPDKAFWTDVSGLLLPAFTAAVDSGYLDVVQWLYTTHLEDLLKSRDAKDRRIVKTENVYLAFQRNHTDVVKFLHTHGLMDWDGWEGGNAAYYCDLPTILWLHAHDLMGEPRNELTSAVYAGRYDCIQWILENRPTEATTYAVEYAAMHGRMDVLELLLAKGLTGAFRAIDYAAGKGHLEIIQRLVEHRRSKDRANTSDEASNAAIHAACLAGHLEVVQFLTEHPVQGGGCTTTAMDSAASKGFLKIVEYLDSHRSEGCTVAAMDAAATNGDLAMVEYLSSHRSDGCSAAALEGAAVNGHFALVRWLMAKYPQLYTPKIAQRAQAKGEFEIALWLEQTRALVPSLPRRPSCSLVTDRVLPPATPIVG